MNFEPPARARHCSAAIDGQLHVYGGFVEDFSRDGETQLFTFSPSTERWEKRGTNFPIVADDYAHTSAGHFLYLYDVTGSLYQLDTRTLNWNLLSQVPPGGGGDYPIHKSGCKMVYYDDKLWLLGGFGTPPIGVVRTPVPALHSQLPASNGPLQLGAKYISGFTNELHMFDLKKGEICYHFV